MNEKVFKLDYIPEVLDEEDLFLENILQTKSIPRLKHPSCKLFDLVKKYAPIVYLHKKEKYLPCDPSEYIADATLYFYGKKKFKMKPINLDDLHKGKIEVSKFWKKYNCNELNEPDVKLIPWNFGFYLRNDTLKYGNKPEQPPEETTIDINAPVYFSFHLDENNKFLIIYWFFYAYNKSSFNFHGGDWERITLRFVTQKEDTNLIYKLDFLNYNWHTFDTGFQPYSFFSWQDDSPLVYSSLGGHASYWAKEIKRNMLDLKKLLDQTYKQTYKLRNLLPIFLNEEKGEGYRWDTSRNLKFMNKNVKWVRFGGIWGPAERLKANSGPITPYHHFQEVDLDENLEITNFSNLKLNKSPIIL